MMDLTAVILAAGRGVRMGIRGTMTPKGLLEIGGEPLVARSVRLLQARGIERIRIVTGHLAEQYEAVFGAMDGVELVHNANYSNSGSLHSMMLGLEGVQGNVVLLESDIVYESRTLDPVIPEVTRLLLSGETLATDEVYVWARPGRNGQKVLKTMNKNIDAQPEQHLGELVGVTCFSSEATQILRETGATHLAHDPKSDYEIVMVKTGDKADIDCHLVEDLSWSEVDDEAMLANAAEKVWPQIFANDAR